MFLTKSSPCSNSHSGQLRVCKPAVMDVEDPLGGEKPGTAAGLWGNLRVSAPSTTARGPHLPAGLRETSSRRASGGGSGRSRAFFQPWG